MATDPLVRAFQVDASENAEEVRRLRAAINIALEHHKWGRYRDMAECLEYARDHSTVSGSQ